MAPASYDRTLMLKAVLSVSGSILEWFDFACFGYLEPQIAATFFPASNESAAKLATFAVFAGAFFMRPVGGLLFGYIGDRFGRKKALFLSIVLMALSTTSIGCLPTYEAAGIAAPILLTFVRMLQGLSVGGQLVGAFLIVLEAAPPHQRCLYSAVILASAGVGSLLGAGFVAILVTSLSEEAMLSYGWRIPFFFGILAGVVSFLTEGKIEEENNQTEVANPIKAAVARNGCSIVLVILACSLWCSGFYYGAVWVGNYELLSVEVPLPNSQIWNSIVQLLSVLLFPLFGLLANRWGFYKLMFRACVAVFILIIPFMGILSLGGTASFWVVLTHITLMTLVTAFGASMGVMMLYYFPKETRYCSVGLAYNGSQALFGGTAPLIASAIAEANLIAPGVFLMITAAISGGTLWYLQKRQRYDTQDEDAKRVLDVLGDLGMDSSAEMVVFHSEDGRERGSREELTEHFDHDRSLEDDSGRIKI